MSKTLLSGCLVVRGYFDSFSVLDKQRDRLSPDTALPNCLSHLTLRRSLGSLKTLRIVGSQRFWLPQKQLTYLTPPGGSLLRFV